jgi:hypothetical protein
MPVSGARGRAGRPLPAAPAYRLSRSRGAAGRWWLAVLLACLAGIAGSLISPAGRHQWALSLFRQPTRYTALSFSRPARLPARFPAGRAVSFSFTIENQQGHPVSYRYIITAVGRRASRVLITAAEPVPPGSSRTVSATVHPRCAQCSITITLPGYPERIDFLVARTARGR